MGARAIILLPLDIQPAFSCFCCCSKVFKATDEATKSRVALKMMLRHHENEGVSLMTPSDC
jgi:hypothetical protein